MGTSAARSVTYSVSQPVPFVNSKDLLRYLPDGMLTKTQSEIKWEAVAETIKKTNNKNDKKYTEYVSKGNLTAAQITKQSRVGKLAFQRGGEGCSRERCAKRNVARSATA